MAHILVAKELSKKEMEWAKTTGRPMQMLLGWSLKKKNI